MDVQQQWKAVCKAFHIRDWNTLETLLEEFQQRLDAGEAPAVSEDVSDGFNHAMASAGVDFIRSHFSRTDEWPVVDTDHRSLRETQPPVPTADPEGAGAAETPPGTGN